MHPELTGCPKKLQCFSSWKRCVSVSRRSARHSSVDAAVLPTMYCIE